jgi:hypothetical protein
MVNNSDSPALRTALAYYHAWTSHDLDKAMSYIADDIVCDAPAGRLRAPPPTGASWARSCGSLPGRR